MLPAAVLGVGAVIPHVCDDAVFAGGASGEKGRLHRRGHGRELGSDMNEAIFLTGEKAPDERHIGSDMSRGESDDIEDRSAGQGGWGRFTHGGRA